MLVLTLVLAFGFEGWHLVRERRTAAALSSAAKGKPNVLLIMLDTVRALNLSLYGYGRATTPALDRWSHGGVVFERALSTAPWTLASHASVMTGHLPHELSVDWLAPLDATYPTLAERLQAEGYFTAGIVANTEYCSAETGLSRGFVHYEDYVPSLTRGLQSVSLGRLFMSSRVLRRLLGSEAIPGRKSAADINRAALHWLSDAGPRPFFMFLNYYDAHAPYLPPAPYAGRFGPIAPRTNVRLSLSARWDSTEIQLQENAYDASIAYLDAQLGELFDSLAARGVLENTLVVLTADHGEEFHEHGVMGHGNSLYYPSVHVPLVVALPGRVPGDRRVQTPVSLRDVPATILDLVGVPDERPFPGRTLARFWSAGSAAPTPGDSVVSEIRYAPGLLPHYAVAKGDMQSVLFENHRYIHNLGDGHEELYDIGADPGEREDLANTDQGRELVQKLRKVMKSIAPVHAGATR
jgi:arylsulfatase A-like enzyme